MTGRTLSMEDMGERIVGLLLMVQIICAFILWSLDSLDDQNWFALYLAIDFVAFAMMSYVYRAVGSGNDISKTMVLAGCFFIAALFFVAVTFPV